MSTEMFGILIAFKTTSNTSSNLATEFLPAVEVILIPSLYKNSYFHLFVSSYFRIP